MAKVVYPNQGYRIILRERVQIRTQAWHKEDRYVIPNDALLEGL